MNNDQHGDNDVAFAVGVVGKLLLDSVLEFRWRHIGWIPLGALWVYVAYFLHVVNFKYITGFRSIVVAIYLVMRVSAIQFWSLLFFSVASCQLFAYRNERQRTLRLAGFSALIHGCVMAFYGLFWSLI